MRSNYALCLLFIFLFMGCNVHEEDYAQRIVKELEKNKVDIRKYTHIAIIPEEGCGGCISEAEHFFRENVDSAILFIFTKVRSKKGLRLRLGVLLDRSNVLIDTERKYVAQKEEMNIYPIIVDVRDERKYAWLFLEPGISYKNVLEQFDTFN